MTREEKLQVKLDAANRQLAEKEVDRVDPAIIAKANTNASYALKDIALAFEAIGQELTAEQVSTIREAVQQSKLEFALAGATADPQSLTAPLR